MLLLGLSTLSPRLLNNKKLHEMVLGSQMHPYQAKATLGKLALSLILENLDHAIADFFQG